MEWYYADGGQRAGPVEESELQSLYVSGKVRADTLVWKAGMADWQPLGAAQPPFLASAPPEGFCTECGRPFGAADLVAFGASRVCANCKDGFFQRVRERGSAVATAGAFTRYGGFWIRVLGRMIDGLILSVVFLVLCAVWGLFFGQSLFPLFTGRRPPNSADVYAIWGVLGIIYVIFFAVSLSYEAWFLANRGGTPGKLVLGLRVVRSNGTDLTTGRGLGRALAYLLNSFIPFAIGFIIAGFDSEKRALHDHLCDTRVIYKSA